MVAYKYKHLPSLNTYDTKAEIEAAHSNIHCVGHTTDFVNGNEEKYYVYDDMDQTHIDAITDQNERAEYDTLKKWIGVYCMDYVFRAKGKRANGHTAKHDALEADFETNYARYEVLNDKFGD